MMTPLLAEDPTLLDEPPLSAAKPSHAVPPEVAEHVVKGISILSAAVFVERGAAFLSNVLAVRFAGPAVYGAYSLGITTANNVSVYAAGGIGTTATRFSGKYAYEGGSYRVFAQVMATISLLSAALAALALALGAGPIAAVLHRPDLAGLMRIAGITAAGMVLLECARGFLVGQRRLLALGILSLAVGFGMLALIPAVARTRHPAAMVLSHGIVTLSAVTFCCVMAARLKLLPPVTGHESVAFFPLIREVWSYSFVQLSGLVSANLAGWWVTALVARGDATLVQISFFSIASQLRNLIGLIPALLTEGSFSAMAAAGDGKGTAYRVMVMCTLASTAVSFLIAAVTMIAAPLLLRLVYGHAYNSAAMAVSIAAGVAVVQMGNAPASARLSVASIGSVAAINTTWALVTAGLGTLLMMRGGNAALAMAVFLAAHILIAALVLFGLHRRDRLPGCMTSVFIASTLGVLGLTTLAAIREAHPSQALPLSLCMTAVAVIASACLYRVGKEEQCLPSHRVLQARLRGVKAWLRRPEPATPGGQP